MLKNLFLAKKFNFRAAGVRKKFKRGGSYKVLPSKDPPLYLVRTSLSTSNPSNNPPVPILG